MFLKATFQNFDPHIHEDKKFNLSCIDFLAYDEIPEPIFFPFRQYMKEIGIDPTK